MSLAKVFERVSWGTGLKSGVRTTWELGKIVFPVTVVVSVVRYTPLYDGLVSGMTPLMGLIGLPGEAAVPLVLGNLLNLYASIGAILTMDLSVKEVFILALMLGFSHGLPLETAICRRIGVSAALVIGFRVAVAIAAAAAVNLVWSGGGEKANYGLVASSPEVPSGVVEIVTSAFATAGMGILQLALIVIPVMLFIQVLKDLGVLDRFAQLVRPLMKPLGIAPRGAVTMAGGLIFGLAFGAGVIIEQVREQKFERREITLMVLFLCACHAVVEDTLIFIPLGVPVGYLLLIRLGTAILLTLLIARLWRAD